jgi:hypothetical protein
MLVGGAGIRRFCDRNDICRLVKAHPFNHRKTVFLPEMAVAFHCQRAAILVTKPAAHGRNIHAGLDAGRGEEVPKVVVRECRQ